MFYQIDVFDGRWAMPEPTTAAITTRLLKNMMADGARGGKQIRKKSAASFYTNVEAPIDDGSSAVIVLL